VPLAHFFQTLLGDGPGEPNLAQVLQTSRTLLQALRQCFGDTAVAGGDKTTFREQIHHQVAQAANKGPQTPTGNSSLPDGGLSSNAAEPLQTELTDVLVELAGYLHWLGGPKKGRRTQGKAVRAAPASSTNGSPDEALSEAVCVDAEPKG
jgi:hypothetical protein